MEKVVGKEHSEDELWDWWQCPRVRQSALRETRPPNQGHDVAHFRSLFRHARALGDLHSMTGIFLWPLQCLQVEGGRGGSAPCPRSQLADLNWHYEPRCAFYHYASGAPPYKEQRDPQKLRERPHCQAGDTGRTVVTSGQNSLRNGATLGSEGGSERTS